MVQEKIIKRQERVLFFKTWVKNPFQMGTFAPISQKLADLVASHVSCDEEVPLVEVGAGTGRLTRALLRKGVDPDFFIAVELDRLCCHFLRESCPGVQVVRGDAQKLTSLIPEEWKGQIQTIVSALPFMYMKQEVRDAILDELLSCVRDGGSIVHVTYHPKSPFSYRSDIKQHRLNTLFMNVPPAFVWSFQRKNDQVEQDDVCSLSVAS